MAGGVKSYIRSLVRENEQKSEHVKDGRAQTQGKNKVGEISFAKSFSYYCDRCSLFRSSPLPLSLNWVAV